MGIKNFLENRLPVTRRFVDRRLNKQYEIIKEILEKQRVYNDELEKNIIYLNSLIDGNKTLVTELENLKKECNASHLYEKINETLKKIENNIDRQKGDFNNKNEDILREVKNIYENIPNKPILWKNSFEKRVVTANWGDVFKHRDFTDKYLQLISGMDEESIDCIGQILARQHVYLNCDNPELKCFTQSEQNQLRKLEDDFYNRIYQINDNLYIYKKYLLPINHFEPSVFYYKHGTGNLRFPSTMKDKSIIDVGGFIGDSVLVLNDIPHKNIISFEVDPNNFKLLKKTIELNKIKGVVCENIALGAKAGTIVLHRKGAMSTTVDRGGIVFEGDIEVPVESFDQYVSKYQISCGLIKIDIEGAESNFLEGAKDTICSQRPILLISIYHNAHDFFEIKPMIESWNAGYKFTIYKPIIDNCTSETLLVATQMSDKEINTQ